MKVDRDSFKIRCAIGENIRFEVYSHGTEHIVTYDLAGESRPLSESEAISLYLDEPKSERLSLSFAFSEPMGGAYDINIIGGDAHTYKYTVKQAPGQQVALLAFGLEGDPGEDL